MLMEGFQLIINTPMSITWVAIGVAVGIVFGVVPGLTATMAIAIFLPITFRLSQVEAISTMVALYIGGMAGGLVPSILLNMPGTPASIATCFDGYPMALKGQADKALGAGILFSFLGTLFSIAALVSVAPVLAGIAIRFGPHEYFAITFFSMSLIITLSSSSLRKGLMTGMAGIMLSMVGLDPIEASPRFVFGIPALRGGFNVLTVLVGLYAIVEVFNVCKNADDTSSAQVQDVSMKGFGINFQEFKGQLGNFFRSALIGVGIGILPAIGGGTSNLVSYTMAKDQSKDPDSFGKGNLAGVVAPETTNSANIGGSMVPLLSLGIPGDTATAMMLGGFMIHGITPGPLIYRNHGDLLYAIFILMVLASFMMLIMMVVGLKGFIKMLKIPKYYLMPAIIIMCAVGAFGLNNRIFDIGGMLFFGIVGLLITKLGFPLPPMVLGFILGPILENNLRRGLTSSQGNFFEFFTRPISGTIIIFTLLFVAYSIFKIYRNQKTAA